MSEASRLNVKLGIQGKEEAPLQLHRRRPPTMNEVLGWIKSLGLEAEIEEELIKKAKQYPIDAMHRFRDKISRHINEIQKNKLKEKNGN